MDTLFLGDLRTEDELKDLLMEMFNTYERYNEAKEDDRSRLEVDSIMRKYKFLIVQLDDSCYESSCYMLLKDNDNNYYTIYGGHCSCYGYEGQFQPTPCNIHNVLDNISYEMTKDEKELATVKVNEIING